MCPCALWSCRPMARHGYRDRPRETDATTVDDRFNRFDNEVYSSTETSSSGGPREILHTIADLNDCLIDTTNLPDPDVTVLGRKGLSVEGSDLGVHRDQRERDSRTWSR